MAADKPATPAYKKDFAFEVYEKVDSGEELKLCMQCGVCGATCPLRDKMEYGPRQIWTLVRSGQRDKVLNSPDIMLCTSCYTCKVRCPRGVKVIDIMHGLAHYALEQGIKPREETAKFGGLFWKSIYKLGRVDEAGVAMEYSFIDGFGQGIKNSLEMMPIGLSLMKTKRMKPKLFPKIGGKAIKGISDLQKMLDKAATMKEG